MSTKLTTGETQFLTIAFLTFCFIALIVTCLNANDDTLGLGPRIEFERALDSAIKDPTSHKTTTLTYDHHTQEQNYNFLLRTFSTTIKVFFKEIPSNPLTVDTFDSRLQSSPLTLTYVVVKGINCTLSISDNQVYKLTPILKPYKNTSCQQVQITDK